MKALENPPNAYDAIRINTLVHSKYFRFDFIWKRVRMNADINFSLINVAYVSRD